MIAFSSRLNHAIRVATRAHEGQFRKGSDTPCIAHPMAVAMITQQYLEDEDLFIAALFHDILEDVP
jgi:(p)ppGpp synthase/HD superfamily hydrolase